jgi:23S rRNA pseudouridine1911/1915/1917 synthase
MAVYADGAHGKSAITHYKVLERFGLVTLIECKLETGRTHQIRAHFQSLGHPLFNDLEYGGNKIVKGTRSSSYERFVQNCLIYYLVKPYMQRHLDLFSQQHVLI